MKSVKVWSHSSWDHDDVTAEMSTRLANGWEIVTVQYSAVSRAEGGKDTVYMSACMKLTVEESPAG